MSRMLGTWLFWYLTRSNKLATQATQLIQACLPISATCLVVAVFSLSESIRFLAFYIFELSLGIYFPSIALLKSRVIPETNRGWTYGLMRLPLNVFITVILCSTGEGSLEVHTICKTLFLTDNLQRIYIARTALFSVVAF